MSLTRRSRTIKYLLLTLLLLGVLSVAIVGLKGISDLVHLGAFISDYNAGGASQSQMFNLLGLLLRLGVPFGRAKTCRLVGLWISDYSWCYLVDTS